MWSAATLILLGTDSAPGVTRRTSRGGFAGVGGDLEQVVDVGVDRASAHVVGARSPREAM